MSRVPRGGVVPRFDRRQIHSLPNAAIDRPNARIGAPRLHTSELLFVDPSVSDLGTILRNLRPQVEAIVLDAERPAARQMALALEGRDGLDAVHVIAHGAPGRVCFAAGEWSARTLQYDEADLATIGQALGQDGEFRVWSCYAGQGRAGRAFVEGLAHAVGVGVRAPTKPVGSAALGGSWVFAGRARRVPPQPPLTGRGLEVYAGLLADVYRIVSGDVPHDPAENVTYVVVNSRDKRVVATFSLPGHANIPRFSLKVAVPSESETYEAGRLDELGKFIPADFMISQTSQLGAGRTNAWESPHGV
ncbi:DUF4347 domain-containing protein [Mesorhizobium sp. NZP2077]|nr:DUF4347 domain-containing protein [Mesorhizobium sp. NZP2077]